MLRSFLSCFCIFLWTVPSLAATTEEVKDVAKELVCLCGDCNRESLAKCICTSFAVPERANIGRLLDQGKSHQEIIDEYVSMYGQIALASPPAEGYNLLAWITPFALLIFGVFLVRSVLLNWRGKPPDKTVSETPITSEAPTTVANTKERERLRRELDRFDEGE